MKWIVSPLAAALILLLPSDGKAQSIARVECPRSDGYVYLYSSWTTLDVRTTLPCGEQVQITGRFDRYFSVRTAKGEVGYLPQTSVLLIRDADGPKAPQPAPQPPARERTPYDAPAPAEPAKIAPASASDFVLRNGTQIRLRLGKTLSSSAAKVGDHVEFEVADDVTLDGVCVIAKGAPALGTVTDAEPKRRLGHGGKLGVSLNSVRLVDNENAAVRGYQEAQGSSSTAGAVLPMVSGKDVALTQGTEFTALVDGDVHLKRESFAAKQNAAAGSAQNAPQPPN